MASGGNAREESGTGSREKVTSCRQEFVLSSLMLEAEHNEGNEVSVM